jgi:hypothetical protein
MEPTTSDTRASSISGIAAWLRAPVTVTLPGWTLAAGAAGLVALALVALD